MQYYGILDFRSLPLEAQATLAMGLPPESRTVRKVTGVPFGMDTLLLAGILDQLRLQTWSRTKGAKTGKNKPKSVLSALLEKRDEEKIIRGFGSGADYEAYRAELLRR